MAFWNYRVVKQYNKEFNEDYYAIHEAYYNEKGEVEGITVNPVSPMGNTLEELQRDCQNYLSALTKLVIDAKDLETYE